MAGHVGHVPVISDGHWVVIGCDLIGHGSVLGVGAEGGQNYSEAPDGEGCDQPWFLVPGVFQDGGRSPSRLGLCGSLMAPFNCWEHSTVQGNWSVSAFALVRLIRKHCLVYVLLLFLSVDKR